MLIYSFAFFRYQSTELYPATTDERRMQQQQQPPRVKDPLMMPPQPQRRKGSSSRKMRPKSLALAGSERQLEEALARRSFERDVTSQEAMMRQSKSVANLWQSRSNRTSPRKDPEELSQSGKFKSEVSLYQKNRRSTPSPRKAKDFRQRRVSAPIHDEDQFEDEDDYEQFYPRFKVIRKSQQHLDESDSESEFYSILGGAI